MQTQNFMSNVMLDSRHPEPAVGMGATICMYTDRHAATIVKVTPTQIHVQRDNTKRIDSNGMSDSQAYEYAPNTSAPVEIFRKTKRGYRSKNRDYLIVGVRREFYDYSF